MGDVNELFDALRTRALRTRGHEERGQRLPPVERWHPDRVGRIDIRIAADGTWYHESEPIRRPALVRVFSTVLRRDPDGYCLVTPAEKLLIEVEDAPFVAVDMEVEGQGGEQVLAFLTNVDDAVAADAEHPIRVEGLPDRPRPYVRVRGGLDARIDRAVYYRLAELCERDREEYWITSAGARFRIG